MTETVDLTTGTTKTTTVNGKSLFVWIHRKISLFFKNLENLEIHPSFCKIPFRVLHNFDCVKLKKLQKQIDRFTNNE